MTVPFSQTERLGRLTTDLGPDTLALLRFDGTDHLNDLFARLIHRSRTVAVACA